jgi:hypothetical protein
VGRRMAAELPAGLSELARWERLADTLIEAADALATEFGNTAESANLARTFGLMAATAVLTNARR